MLTVKFIVFGIIMAVLSISMAFLLLNSKEESKVTRIGFLLVSLGFALYSMGLFATMEPTRALATFIIGSGIITCGIGYQSVIPKVLHIIAGIVIYIIMFDRFVL